MLFDPKTKALAYRIWAFAEPLGWNATVREIADHLDVSIQAVINALRYQGWSDRVRVQRKENPNSGPRRGKPENWVDPITMNEINREMRFQND